jgi:ATP-dependent Clp protease protease subunit
MTKKDDVLGIALTPELHPLQAELLGEQIRHERAQAALAEIELAVKEDAERDRLVKAGKVRHLWLSGPISEANCEKWINALQHWERRDPGLPITIDINSQGGSVTDGLALYDQIIRMRRAGHEVITRGTGLVASMAAVLLQAGDERVMDTRAKMLIHEGSSTLVGTFTRAEQEDYKSFGDMLIADILDILSERSTLSRRQIQAKWKRKDWWLTAAEAVKAGFADRVE